MLHRDLLQVHRGSAEEALEWAGLELVGWYTDPKQLFGMALAKRA